MEKLKPLITHHFWILFALVLLLPVMGWWPTVGEFSKQTEAKVSAIDQAFSQVPIRPQANQSWVDRLNKIAENAEEQDREQRIVLWKRQWDMMTWPNTIRKDLQPKSYRAEISPLALNIYKSNYALEIRRVWQAANPFDLEDGKGTVLLGEESIPREQFGDLPPTSEELWDVQEDLWLLEALLHSIKEANQGTSLISDSLVRSIQVIRLVGGPGNYPDVESSSEMGGGMGAEFGGEMEMSEFTGMEGMNMGGMSNRGTVGPGNVSFDPSEEFGEEQGRYIDFEEGSILRKRGFYLEAIIDHERLPDLLVALSNNAWPVSITRVQMAKASPSATSPKGGGGLFPRNDAFSPGGSPFSASGAFPGSGFDNPEGQGGPRGSVGGNKFAELAKAAVMGNNLANVAISGVIFIYNPPAESDVESMPEETTEEMSKDSEEEIPTDSTAPELTKKPNVTEENKEAQTPKSASGIP